MPIAAVVALVHDIEERGMRWPLVNGTRATAHELAGRVYIQTSPSDRAVIHRSGSTARSGATTNREPERDMPRIVEERSVIGPHGEEEHELVDDRGRHFWSLRPAPARRYDAYGFGWFWWLVLWPIVIGLIVWGWGWGWGY
jgi:hypothetical protein